MLYKFRSKAGGDVIMLQPQGDQLLRALGREPAPQGIVLAADLGRAVAVIEQAIVDDEAAFAQAVAEAQASGAPTPRRLGVQLRQRAWPLLELMRRALAEDVDVVWGA
ncbi:MAG: DUF1840 domain-containing protein [Paucibacter sp.]|nr:DUF1840 domain-containing protein [Roseateles sp.]